METLVSENETLDLYSGLHKGGERTLYLEDREVNLYSQIVLARNRIETLNNNINAKQQEIQEIQGQYNFFKLVLSTVQNSEENVNCSICLDDLVEFQIAKCGHIHCDSCVSALFNRSLGAPLCSMCRQPISRTHLMRMNRRHLSEKTKATGGNADDDTDQYLEKYSKYGTKLAQFVKFMAETLKETPNAKIILFIQFQRLMKLVSDALHEFGVAHVRCTGNVGTKNKAINEFKTSPANRLILLSSEDSVSGLHLTNATHVVIFHPFLINEGDHELAMAYEKQGIARAWRSGLEHPVKVVRFVVRDSIESQLAERRGYHDGVIKELDYKPPKVSLREATNLL